MLLGWLVARTSTRLSHRIRTLLTENAEGHLNNLNLAYRALKKLRSKSTSQMSAI